MAERSRLTGEQISNQEMEQLPLEGFPEFQVSIPARLRLIASGKLIWDAFRHPLTGSTLIMDAEANEVRIVHWNNPKELIKERLRRYKPLWLK